MPVFPYPYHACDISKLFLPPILWMKTFNHFPTGCRGIMFELIFPDHYFECTAAIYISLGLDLEGD